MKTNAQGTIDQLFDGLPEEERITAGILRDLVKEHLPNAREKLSWGAPFYHGRRSVCFIWPASIPWGKLENGVALGFSRARELDHHGFLGFDTRKQVGRHLFLRPEEINIEVVVGLLQQAWLLDQTR
jgi:hypothetical protein